VNRLLVLVVSVLVLWSCGSGEKTKLETRLTEVREKLERVERQTSPSDTAAVGLMDQARERLDSVEDLIIESEYAQANDLLDLTDRTLSDYLDNGTVPSVARAQPLRIHGRVSYKTRSSEEYEPLDENENPRRISAIRTAIRAGAYMELASEVTVTLSSESELLIEAIRAPNRAYVLTLAGGTFQLEIGGGSVVELILAGQRMAVQGPAQLEVANLTLTGAQLISVFQGRVTWEKDKRVRELTNLQGIRITEDEMRRSSLPGRPVISSPADKATLYTDSAERVDVEMVWSSSALGGTQLQVSDDPFFFTRIFDRSGLEDSQVSSLSPGTYYWRVRSFSNDRLPGPFSKTQQLTVSRGSGPKHETANQPTKPRGQGPPVSDVRMEIFKPTMLVTGKTRSGARVRVNGEAAVVLEDGKFRAVINIASGKQTLRIEATDLRTGFTTEWEKDIVVP